MRKFRDIIESPFPVPTNALWLKDSHLKGFISGKWTDIVGSEQPNIPENLNAILDSLPESLCFPKSYRGTITSPDILFRQWYRNEDGTYSEGGQLSVNIDIASPNRYGVVKAANAVADLAGTEDAAAICTKVNALLAALRTAGILTT